MDVCEADYPPFLRYRGPYFGPNRDDPSTFVDDFGCLTRVGSGSLGRNQPFEETTTSFETQ